MAYVYNTQLQQRQTWDISLAKGYPAAQGDYLDICLYILLFLQQASTRSMGISQPSILCVSPPEPPQWLLTSHFNVSRSILSAALSPNLSPQPQQWSTPPAPFLGFGDSRFQLSATHINVGAAFHNPSALSFLQGPMALHPGGAFWASSPPRHSHTFASQLVVTGWSYRLVWAKPKTIACSNIFHL